VKPDAKSDAEISREYRRGLKAEGRKAINVYLETKTKNALARICEVKSMTIAEAME
jgi:hypothetical protein